MNMRDIAKLAGVSSATVSNVINGSSVVRPDTAARVRKVIEETRFVPNGSAATLKYGRSSSYGLIIPDITNPFFPEFIRSFEGILANNSQDMFLATTDLHVSRMQQTIRRMLIRQVDGVALLAAEIETEPIEALIHHRVPLVTMDRRAIGPGLSDVMIDYLSGMREAINHLRDLGHQRIAYIGGSSGLTISDHRITAFREAMSGAGLTVHAEYIRAGNYRINGGESCMEELFQLDLPPTAIMSANDLTAIGALRAIRRHGLSVPEDFSVVGFDDSMLMACTEPPLTTVRQPIEPMGRSAVTTLLSLVGGAAVSSEELLFAPELVVRASTGPAAAIPHSLREAASA